MAVTKGGEVPPASNLIPSNVRTVSLSLWREYAYGRASAAAMIRALSRRHSSEGLKHCSPLNWLGLGKNTGG
jgi:hypothetical protein